MVKRAHIEIALTLFVVAGGVGWCAERDSSLRAEGRAEIYEARVDSLEEIARADSIMVAALAAVSDSAVAELKRVKASSDSTINELRNRRPQVITRVVERVVHDAGEDSALVRHAVEEVRAATAASYEEEIDVLHLAMVQHEQTIYALTDERDALRVEVGGLKSLVASLEAVNEAQRQSGTLLDTTVGKIALVVGSVGIGYAIGN